LDKFAANGIMRRSDLTTALTIRAAPLDCASRQQPKGGDPVSHYHMPGLASATWIFVSIEVAAA
jgi:hypothetical protein